MMQYFPGAWPSWLSEGLAEYYMTADLLSKTILVGGWNSERVLDLANENWVPLSDLLSKGPFGTAARLTSACSTTPRPSP